MVIATTLYTTPLGRYVVRPSFGRLPYAVVRTLDGGIPATCEREDTARAVAESYELNELEDEREEGRAAGQPQPVKLRRRWPVADWDF